MLNEIIDKKTRTSGNKSILFGDLVQEWKLSHSKKKSSKGQ